MQTTQFTQNYHHHLVKGSPYEVGRQQGELIKGIPLLCQSFINQPEVINQAVVGEGLILLQQFAPRLLEELQGMADSLNIHVNQLVFLSETCLTEGHCSQFIARNGQDFSQVRNYEFSPLRDDFRLVTTAVNGAYRHIGFSVMFSGRYEGINEHGLVITMTATGIPVGIHEGMSKPNNAGLQFWVLIRLILDHCKDISEALEIIRDFPLSSNTNFLLSDANGQTALVETYGKIKSVRMIGDREICVSTNHYTIPDMKSHVPMILENSMVRYDQIHTMLSSAHGQLSSENLKLFLNKTYPEGINVPYYDEFFGTLRSMIFNPKGKWVEICFGMPKDNQWLRYHVMDEVEKPIIPAVFLNQKAPSSFWKMIPAN